MINVLKIIFCLVLTDFYIFPFEPVVLPGINVKMILAGLSLLYICFLLAKKRTASIDADLLKIFFMAVPISLFSLLSNVINDTNDYSFNFYFVSVFVWMAAGFFVVSMIKVCHDNLSLQLVANYLIGVCCLQCILAMCMEYNPALKIFVDGLMGGSEAFMGDAGDRVHGLGCALDVAGGRFAAVLIFVSYFITNAVDKLKLFLYISAFILIAVVGNMIARTTTVGVVLSLLYMLYDYYKGNPSGNRFGVYFTGVLCLVLPVIVVLYNINDMFYQQVRFGFEGFFSLVETGRWESSSNDILFEYMIVFPDNLKTWLIGDGYGANPIDVDPYYLGKSFHGFYMGTDIGYLRFIFFFGIFGMTSMIALFVYFGEICLNRFRNFKNLIILLLVLNLVIWFKATTDLLPIFAILLCIGKEEHELYEYEKCYHN